MTASTTKTAPTLTELSHTHHCRLEKRYRMSGHLCEELIAEILTRLPSKSLVRFRSLSKYWYSYIGSPSFIGMHTFRSPQKLLIRHQEHGIEDFYTLHSEGQLPLCPRRGYVGITAVKFPYRNYSNIVGSSNGILCLFQHRKNCITLLNPSIRRKLTLPKCPFRCRSRSWIGFGFDPITNDYKIVRISNRGGSSTVYAMKIGAWCAIDSPTPLFSKVISEITCFLNGSFHWLVERLNIKPHEVDRRYIMTFDLSTHVFGMITLPQRSNWRIIELTIIQGFLAVIAIEGDDSLIWVLRDDSWSVFYKWKTNQVKGGLKGVLQLTRNGDLLFITYLRGFQIFNLKTGVQQSTLVSFNAASCLRDIVQCVESLELLDVGTAAF